MPVKMLVLGEVDRIEGQISLGDEVRIGSNAILDGDITIR